jgi:hypothetical protein
MKTTYSNYDRISIATLDLEHHYIPFMPPQADSDELDKRGRVLLYFRPNCGEIEIKLIPANSGIYAGWIIGILPS